MRLCSIDTTLNENLDPQTIIDAIDPEIANIKFNIIKKIGAGMDRKTLEKSHILFISLPRKKLTQEQYIDLISYVDIGGCLILTLPSPPWDDLGRFFEELRKELGFSFKPNFVFGFPKIPKNTRLVGSTLTITKAHVIDYNLDEEFLKESGIKGYIPLALMDNRPVILSGIKRRGNFIIFSTPEIFRKQNSDFLNRLILLITKRENLLFTETAKTLKFGDSNFHLRIQHACLDSYLLSLFHYKFMFYQEVISYTTIEELSQSVYNIVSEQRVLGELPKLEDILNVLKKGIKRG